MILFVQYRPGCKLQHNNNNDVHNSNLNCFLTTFFTTKSVQICQKVVTEKTVTNLNLNFKFLFNVKFGSWAFRNCAHFVMKPSGCDTVRLSVQPNPYYGRQPPFEMPMYQIQRNQPHSDHIWPASLVFCVQELVLGGMGLAQTARSTLPPTMVVTDSKK